MLFLRKTDAVAKARQIGGNAQAELDELVMYYELGIIEPLVGYTDDLLAA